MATTTKKGSKNKKAKLRRPVVKTSRLNKRRRLRSYASNSPNRLQRESATAIENVRLFSETHRGVGAADGDERNPARDCQLADGYQPVLDAIAENAASLCDAATLRCRVVDGDVASPRRRPIIPIPSVAVGRNRPLIAVRPDRASGVGPADDPRSYLLEAQSNFPRARSP